MMRIKSNISLCSRLLSQGCAKFGFFSGTYRGIVFTKGSEHNCFNGKLSDTPEVKTNHDNQKVVMKPLAIHPEQVRKILAGYNKSFDIEKGEEPSDFRIYSRLLGRTGVMRKDSFMTFKPRINHIYWNQSPILKELIRKDTGLMGYGLALYNGVHKVWVAPYGNQLEFMQALCTNYAPFIDLPDNPGIPHYIGFFPDLHYHQIYYYLGSDAKFVDLRLADLKPDYFGFSRTYDCKWNVIKENTYAIRVPLANFANTELCKKYANKEVLPYPYVNISYRRVPGTEAEEESISHLCYKSG